MAIRIGDKVINTPEEKKDKTPEEAEKIAEQKVARVIQVLYKGILNDRVHTILNEAVPEGRVGKFVRDDPEEIIRYQNLGYTFEVNEGAKGLHGTGDGKIRVGDCVLMTISVEDHEILKRARRETIKSKIGEGRREYMKLAEEHAKQSGVRPFDRSMVNFVGG